MLPNALCGDMQQQKEEARVKPEKPRIISRCLVRLFLRISLSDAAAQTHNMSSDIRSAGGLEWEGAACYSGALFSSFRVCVRL